MASMAEELAAYLNALERGDSYRVDRVLSSNDAESTEVVYFVGAHGGERGPFIRKRFSAEHGLGGAYERIWQAQQAGRRFRYLPHIEECYTTGSELVVVSEYVQGETLSDIVYRCDPSVVLAADIFPRLCDAVSELHESFDPPIIHRDLKPSNVILSQGALTLIDFGIARSYDAEADVDTHRFGTRAYAPPEQFGFGQTDVRSDVHALGLLLYYLLTERNPDADARAERWRAPGVPEQLRALIERAASFDPADRYASADELKRAFLQALAGQVPDARGRSPLEALRASLCSLLASVPPALGIAWNVFLVLLLAFFFAACINSALNPVASDTAATAPVWLRLLSYLLMFFLMFVPVAFAICDRRPLRKRFKVLARTPLAKQIGIALIVAFLGFCATGISTAFFPK